MNCCMDVISHYVYNFFPLTLLNVLSFTSNSYFVSINSVSIIRNCRVVTIQMKLVLTNSIFPLQRMKLRCHKCIYTAKFQMHKEFYKINVLHIF